MSKYNSKKVTLDGIKFDSKKEARRYKELKLLERAGEIKNLELQPRFLLQDRFRLDGKSYRKIEYVSDFKYFDNRLGLYVIEDTKGFKTDVYKLKKKLFLKKYGEKYQFIET